MAQDSINSDDRDINVEAWPQAVRPHGASVTVSVGLRWPRRARCSATASPTTRWSTSPASSPSRTSCRFSAPAPASRFAAKVIPAPSVGGVRETAAAAPEMLSIPEEAARLWVAECSEQERGWAPRVELESLLGLMHVVALLRAPLLFGRAHGSVTLSEGDC